MGKIDKRDFSGILNYCISFYVLTYVLPTGTIGGFDIQKHVLYICLVMSLMAFIQKGVLTEIIKKSKFEIVMLLIGAISCVWSLLNGNTLSIKFAGLLYINIIFFLIIFFLNDYRLINIKLIVKSIVIMLLLKIVGKLVIEAFFVFELISYEGIIDLYRQLFSTEASTMTMEFGKILLVRIQSPSDIIVVSLMPFLWVSSKLKRKEKIAFFILAAVYTMIVFSRMLIVQFCCYAVIILFSYRKKVSKRNIYIGMTIMLLLAVLLFEPIVEMIKFRFFSSFTVESDSIRMIQIENLIEGIKNRPLFGYGMGSYLPNYIRSVQIPFSYEAEYLSFIYQLGIIGFVVLIGGYIAMVLLKLVPYLKKSHWLITIISVLGLGWYLIRPFFNPTFLGLQNGFSIIGILVFNAYYAEKNDV